MPKRIQSNAWYKALFFSSNEGLFLVDGDGVIGEVNESGVEVVGLSDREKVVGENITKFFESPSRLRVRLLLGEIRRLGSVHRQIRVFLGGKMVYFDIMGTAGVLDGMSLLAVRDVTRWVEEANSREKFVSLAAHELKSPLAVIKAYNELIGKNVGVDRKLMGYVEKVNQKVDVLSDYIGAIVDEVRLGTGKFLFRDKTHVVDGMIKEIVLELRKIFPKRQIILSGQCMDKVVVDKERIFQVVRNLVSNAVKYSAVGKPVEVKVDCNHFGVRISVVDKGIGISRKDKKNLFKAFYRGVASEKKSVGLGLGLYIARQIVNRYGGRIGVRSTEGVGSTFYFDLPVK